MRFHNVDICIDTEVIEILVTKNKILGFDFKEIHKDLR